MRKKIENVLVVTMNPTRRCFVGCIGIENDRIAYVGPNDRLQNNDWIGVTSIDAPKRCLALSGFFESHVHVTYLPWRYDKREGRSRAKRATPSEKMGLIKRTRREAVRAGVTFLCDFAPYNDGVLKPVPGKLSFEEVLDDLHSSKLGGLLLARLPEENENGELKVAEAERFISKALDMLSARQDGSPLRLFVHLPVERKLEYSDAILESYANAIGPFRDHPFLWIHAHCCEFASRARYAKRSFQGRTSVEILDGYGFLYDRTLLAHCIHVDASDLDLIKERKARVVSVPKFTDGKLATLGAMIDRGIKVGLCSDAYAVDPLSQIVHGYHLHRCFANLTEGSRPLAPFELLSMATCGAADAVGLADDTGSLQEGKRADIVLLDLDAEVFDSFWKPDFWVQQASSPMVRSSWTQPIEQLIHCRAISCREVCKVIIGGEVVWPSETG